MNKEIKILLIGLVILLVISLVDLNHRVTNRPTKAQSFIKNSNGNLYPCTDEGLQQALDDLNGTDNGIVDCTDCEES